MQPTTCTGRAVPPLNDILAFHGDVADVVGGVVDTRKLRQRVDAPWSVAVMAGSLPSMVGNPNSP